MCCTTKMNFKKRKENYFRMKVEIKFYLEKQIFIKQKYFYLFTINVFFCLHSLFYDFVRSLSIFFSTQKS